jgi:hypothetical protein
MKPLNSKRGVFYGLLILSAVFYLVDCFVVSIFSTHSELPWIERGIYAGSPAGILTTASCVIAAFGILIFGKNR